MTWLDINNTTCKLPQVDGMIIMKVLRKSWVDKEEGPGVGVTAGAKNEGEAIVQGVFGQQTFDLLS